MREIPHLGSGVAAFAGVASSQEVVLAADLGDVLLVQDRQHNVRPEPGAELGEQCLGRREPPRFDLSDHPARESAFARQPSPTDPAAATCAANGAGEMDRRGAQRSLLKLGHGHEGLLRRVFALRGWVEGGPYGDRLRKR